VLEAKKGPAGNLKFQAPNSKEIPRSKFQGNMPSHKGVPQRDGTSVFFVLKPKDYRPENKIHSRALRQSFVRPTIALSSDSPAGMADADDTIITTAVLLQHMQNMEGRLLHGMQTLEDRLMGIMNKGFRSVDRRLSILEVGIENIVSPNASPHWRKRGGDQKTVSR
jgi:hypothetical protein